MDGVKRFEDLLIWQKAREFSKEIHLVFRYKNKLDERALTD